MPSDDNKSLNARWIQAFNDRDWATETACRAPDFTAHMSGMPEPLNSAGWDGFMQAFTTAFPDARITPERTLAEGAETVIRWRITGTHRGEFQGVPATGRPVALDGIEWNRFVDGKIAEHWAQFDLVAVLGQIGALPPPA